MTYEITYEFTPAMARRLYPEFVWKAQGEYVVWSVVVGIVAIASIYYKSYPLYSAFLLGVSATWWYWWWTAAKQSVRNVERLHPLMITVTIDEQACTIRTSEATTFAWSTVSRVYKLRSAIVVARHASSAAAAILPKDRVTDEMLAHIEQWASNAGAQVR